MTYLAYAGIGSRKTPDHILNIMSHIGAYLFGEGWTLRSGHADGADKAFEQGADDQRHMADAHFEKKEIYLPWKGFNGSTSTLHPERYPFSGQEISMAANVHPNWRACSPSAQRMHTRNVRQILGLEAIHGPVVIPVKFVVCWTDKGLLKGGTAQAIRIAQSCNIPVINLGAAKTPEYLEQLVLEVDSLQTKFKEEALAA
jgi:hypothetical protein